MSHITHIYMYLVTKFLPPFYVQMHSKGEIENAVKFLEVYVSVAEKAGLQKSLARACSAIGIMYNTLVSCPDPQSR